MNFKNLFDTYTNNVSTRERSNEFDQTADLSNQEKQQLSSFVDAYDSNVPFEDIASAIPEDTPDLPTPTQAVSENASPEISEDILSILSSLDTPAEYMNKENIADSETNEEAILDDDNELDNSIEEIETDNEDVDLNDMDFLDDDLSEEIETDNIDDTIDTFDNVDNDAEDNQPTNDNEDIDLNDIDFLDDDLSEEIETDNIDDNTDTFDNTDNDTEEDQPTNDNEDIDLNDMDFLDESDSFGESDDLTEEADNDDILGNFLDNFDSDESDNTNFDLDDDIEDMVFNEEIDSSIFSEDADMFDIEIPEEEEEEVEEFNDPTLDLDNNLEGFDLPDFSETMYEDHSTDEKTTPTDITTPMDYEEVDKSINFDIWNSQQENSTDEFANLTDEQAFSIRYKINNINDKEQRFKIREIITNQNLNPDTYSKLISLLLINSSEDSIREFLDSIEDEYPTEKIQPVKRQNFSPSFLADDVVNYQDTIYSIKHELLYNLKKYSIYGVITILTGIVSWLGVAQPMRINGIFERGLTAVRNNQFVEGEALFQQANAIAGSPVADWYLKYAEVYKDKNLVTEAREKYHAAITIAPKNIEISTRASDFYTNLGPKYFSNAFSIMDNLSGHHPNKFEVWDYYGSLFIDYSEYFASDRDEQTRLLYDATDIYQEYILNNPNDPAPFYRILEIYIRIGNKEQIDKITSLLTKLNPKNVNIEMMTQLAKYYIDHRNLNRANEIFNKLTPILDANFKDVSPLQKSMQNLYNIDPNNISNIMSESYFEFARYKMLTSDFRSAGIMLTNAILFNPEKEDSYNLLGEAYLRSQEPAKTKLIKAKELFDKTLAFNPNNYKAHINLGHLYYMWDNEVGDVKQAHDNAIYHYKLAESLMPPNVKNTLMSYNYGWLEYQNNNPSAAIDIWSEIYKNNPENPILSYALGSALYHDNNPQLAQVILEKSADSLEKLKAEIPTPNLANRRHREIFTQLAKTYNNIGVINANYGKANRRREEYFDSQALLNFYKAQDLANKIDTIYSTTEYNIGVITRPNIQNRTTIFDNDIPKQTSLENPVNQFNKFLLETI